MKIDKKMQYEATGIKLFIPEQACHFLWPSIDQSEQNANNHSRKAFLLNLLHKILHPEPAKVRDALEVFPWFLRRICATL